MLNNSAAITTRGLSRNFGSVRAVCDLNMKVKKGSVCGFLGRNGAGKTTTIKMLLGLVRPSSGQLSLFGNCPIKNELAVKSLVGYVSENLSAYRWMKVKSLIRFISSFYPDWDDKYCRHLLKIMDLPLKRKVKNLSQGMQKKLMLLLALSHHPQLLILDEPFAGLDVPTRAELLELLAKLNREEERSIFLSSHIVSDMERIADEVIIIDEGQTLVSRSWSDLKNSVKEVRTRGLSENDETPQLPGILTMNKAGDDHLLTVECTSEDELKSQTAKLGLECSINNLNLEDIFLAYIKKADREKKND
jgi:ABC-2 type transport system ATP-binding protein